MMELAQENKKVKNLEIPKPAGTNHNSSLLHNDKFHFVAHTVRVDIPDVLADHPIAHFIAYLAVGRQHRAQLLQKKAMTTPSVAQLVEL